MKEYKVKQGEKIKLDEWDPNDLQGPISKKSKAKDRLDELNVQLEELQELLYAENKNKLLVVLQAMDTGGKDGVIRHVFDGVNPQGVKVTSFKVPTPIELDHDYLWRVHKRTPGKGEIMIFNRSHYEDVLVVRVHNLVPESVWSRRYDHINHFEKMLHDEGTTILKFFLNIDLREQKERLQARLDNPKKNWKFSLGDLKERELWPDYIRAYEEVLTRTSTEWAPWYIIPSNRKWYRNLVIASIMVETMKGFNMSYPESEDDLSGVVIT
ncbi:MAG: polyphosphate kinase 2 family protein [Anaerolineales bacterium]